MNAVLQSICPLCSQVFQSELLHDHIVSEGPRLRHSTIKIIQGYHPGWVEDHGACGVCWRSYRDAGQILNMMKSARLQHPADYWNPVERREASPDEEPTNLYDEH